MPYLLDANACIQFLNDRNSSVTRRMSQLQSDVNAELYYGAWNSSRREGNLARLERFFSQFTVVPFDNRAAAIYGCLRKQLAVQGTPIGGNDLLIAAIALANDLTLVAHNTRAFGRVGGLAIEDWEG